MAKTIESIRLRPNNTEENLSVLREIQSKKKVDARKQDELNALFDIINAKCASKSLAEKKKALASSEKLENVSTAVHYGPLPGCLSSKWWGIRMDCSRDLVHEPFNESIHQGPFGAVSICTSHLNKYSDVDLGDLLTFTSEKYIATDLSKDSLILSYKNKVPIRLVRSYSLLNNYAPKTGYRYDGLYTVVDYWIGVSPDSSQYHKFVLSRVIDQEHAAWTDNTSLKSLKLRKCISPRLTRSHSKVISKKPKATKFTYSKVQKESKIASASAIVSRQVFKKLITESPRNTQKLILNCDPANQSSCLNSCPTKLCNSNLSIRTNLYDSSHKLQDVKKVTNLTFCKIFKSNQTASLSQKNLSEEIEITSSKISDSESMEKLLSINTSVTNECTEKKVKKVTWADSCKSSSNSIEKSVPLTVNNFQYNGSEHIDRFSPTLKKKCILKLNNTAEYLCSTKNTIPNTLLSSTSKDLQHTIQVRSKSTVSQKSKASFSTMCESINETESLKEPSSIDSLAPDKLLSVIVKKKYHPMAKLLIGNMIGSENQESDILSAYNTLTSKVDQEDSKKTKENKLRNKFYIRNKSRKNGILKKQRREIANLIIDAKFDTVTRGLRNRRLRSLKRRLSKLEISQRKVINARRIQSRSLNKEIRNGVIELSKKPQERKVEEIISPKRPKMVTAWTQCTLLTVPSVDQSLQVGNSFVEITLPEANIKVELVDIDDIKLEACDSERITEDTRIEPDLNCHEEINYFTGSAFAAVNTIDSKLRIDHLRSIGFRPIGTYSPIEDMDSYQESYRPEVDEEYNKYTSEENNIVGYMDEELHFEDIEEENDHMKNDEELLIKNKDQLENEFSPKRIQSLSDHDFNKPWHGWRKISANGQFYWTGY